MRYLKVLKKKAQETRERLTCMGLLDKTQAVQRDADHVFFPITSDVGISLGEMTELEGQKLITRPRSLKDALKGRLSSTELDLLQSSYNIIGDIAVLELDDSLLGKKNLIGQTLLRTFSNVKVAAVKTMQVSGEYRVPGIEVVAGENRTETIHKEHGCVYKLDVARAYFSPRLGHERMRVASQIKNTERVLVMFAGVGPYAILAARKTKAEVTAIELNPTAVEYMRWNVHRNKVEVDVLEGDARQILPTVGRFDRIIMPLPKQADTFLDVTLPALKENGIIHYYTFAHDSLEAQGHLAKAMAGLGKRMRILDVAECGSYSPCLSRYCVDFGLQ
jgi:tRNA (guanine37-N1)-methyltransferase